MYWRTNRMGQHIESERLLVSGVLELRLIYIHAWLNYNAANHRRHVLTGPLGKINMRPATFCWSHKRQESRLPTESSGHLHGTVFHKTFSPLPPSADCVIFSKRNLSTRYLQLTADDCHQRFRQVPGWKTGFSEELWICGALQIWFEYIHIYITHL